MTSFYHIRYPAVLHSPYCTLIYWLETGFETGNKAIKAKMTDANCSI